MRTVPFGPTDAGLPNVIAGLMRIADRPDADIRHRDTPGAEASHPKEREDRLCRRRPNRVAEVHINMQRDLRRRQPSTHPDSHAVVVRVVADLLTAGD